MLRFAVVFSSTPRAAFGSSDERKRDRSLPAIQSAKNGRGEIMPLSVGVTPPTYYSPSVGVISATHVTGWIPQSSGNHRAVFHCTRYLPSWMVDLCFRR